MGSLSAWPYGKGCTDKLYLCNRKLRIYYTNTLRGDAHCGVQCRCRKRPPQAQECAKAHSLFYPKYSLPICIYNAGFQIKIMIE